jgi:hypothetical protein
MSNADLTKGNRSVIVLTSIICSILRSNDFKFSAVSLVMLVLNSSEKWRIVRARFSSFVCKSMVSGVSLTALESQFISIGSVRVVIIFLKQISSEDFGSKS